MCTGYERGLKIYYKEKEKINEKKKKICRLHFKRDRLIS